MARMIPSIDSNYIENDAEQEVFLSLKELDNSYTVFYSFKWSDLTTRKEKRNGEVDFLIMHPQKGIAVIEVKRGNVYMVDGDWHYGNGTLMGEDPLEQAKLSMHKIRGTLMESTPNNKIPFVSAVWFPHLINANLPKILPMNYDRRQIFTKESLKDPGKALSSLFTISNFECDFDKERIIRELLPSFNFVVSLSNTIEINNEIINVLTNEQARLIDYLDEQERAVIHGSAGTGKTMIGIQMAEKIASEDKQVLFICYNSYLKSSLEEKFNNPNVKIENVHSLAARYLKTSKVTEEDLELVLETLNKSEFEFDSVIVDEAQDFTEKTILLLDRLVKGKLYLFYDKNQLIQKNYVPKWLEYAECRLVLNKNCRNTLSIAKSSLSPIGVENKSNLKLIEGIRPYVTSDENKGTTLKFLYDEINRLKAQESLNYNQITILTVKTEEKSFLYETKFLEDLKSKGVLFTTTRKFKGLESDIVFIIDLDYEFFKDDLSRRILYVASSRAKNLLYYILNTTSAENNEIANFIKETPETKNGVYALARVLNGQVKEIK